MRQVRTETRVPLRIVAVACAVLATSTVARAQTVDPTFDPGADETVAPVAVQPDGKILVGGSFTTLGGGGTGTLASAIHRTNQRGRHS